jgi:hypothetical protein
MFSAEKREALTKVGLLEAFGVLLPALIATGALAAVKLVKISVKF